MFIAAQVNNIEVVKKLIEHGLSTNETHRDSVSCFALNEAANHRNIAMFELLLENSCPSTYSTEALTGLLHHCLTLENASEFCEILLNKHPEIINKEDNNTLTALEVAAKNGDIKTVKFLLQLGASIGTSNPNNALKYALEGETKAHANVTAYLANRFHLNVSYALNDDKILNNTKITKLHLDCDLNDSSIERLPAHIKKIVYTNESSVACLTLLKARGIKLIGPPLNMFIDEKYLGGHLPSLEKPLKDSPKSCRPLKGIYQEQSKIIVQLPKLKTLKMSEGENNFKVKDIKNTEAEYQFMPALLKAERSKNDKVFTVFGYRQNKACLPIVADNASRCMVVLTVDEYNSLEILTGSDLAKHYDFLILNSRKKIGCDQDVKVSMLTERRRAALNFAREQEINHLVFLDDNITEIALLEGVSSRKGAEYLFDYLKDRMDKTKSVLLSVATESNLNRTLTEKQVGCKAWIKDIKKISDALPEECFQALMPYNEYRWGEDYYLQILLNTLFSNEEDNSDAFTILPIDEIQLKRSSAQKSTCSKGGMRVTEYVPEDVLHPSIRVEIEKKYPEILKKIDLACFRFNEQIRPLIAYYESKKEKLKALDIKALRKKELALDKFDICHIKLPVTRSSSDTTHSLLTKTLGNGDLGHNQRFILIEERLFIAERNPLFVYEIEETPLNHIVVKVLKNNLSDQTEQPAKPDSTTLALIASLTKPVKNKTTLKNEFINDLQALLTDALNENQGFSVKAIGRNITLRDYQNEAIDWLANHLKRSDYKEFTFNMATGTGKTVLMLIIALAAYSANQKSNVMLVFPSIQLVHQTLEKLFTDFKPLLDHFNINREQVFGICSQSSKALKANEIISQDLIAANDGLRNGGSLYLFCAASLKAFNEIEGLEEHEIKGRQTFMSNTSATILDESHKLDYLDKSDGVNLSAMHSLTFKFSATPKNGNDEHCPDNQFQYVRTTAIKEKYLTPLLVDKTLPNDSGNEDINHCLLNHKHPNGGMLKDHKGIIYMTSRKKATVLAKSIQDTKNPEGFPLFGKDFVHVIHSGDTEGIETHCDEDDTAVENFKKRTTGVAIVVRMLTEGYDDDNVDYVIVNKNFDHSEDLHQAIGRTLRFNAENPEKVGYALIRKSNKKIASQEETCYPDDAQKLKKAHEQSVGEVWQTIKVRRSEKDESKSSLVVLSKPKKISQGLKKLPKKTLSSYSSTRRCMPLLNDEFSNNQRKLNLICGSLIEDTSESLEPLKTENKANNLITKRKRSSFLDNIDDDVIKQTTGKRVCSSLIVITDSDEEPLSEIACTSSSISNTRTYSTMSSGSHKQTFFSTSAQEVMPKKNRLSSQVVKERENADSIEDCPRSKHCGVHR